MLPVLILQLLIFLFIFMTLLKVYHLFRFQIRLLNYLILIPIHIKLLFLAHQLSLFLLYSKVSFKEFKFEGYLILVILMLLKFFFLSVYLFCLLHFISTILILLLFQLQIFLLLTFLFPFTQLSLLLLFQLLLIFLFSHQASLPFNL